MKINIAKDRQTDVPAALIARALLDATPEQMAELQAAVVADVPSEDAPTTPELVAQLNRAADASDFLALSVREQARKAKDDAEEEPIAASGDRVRRMASRQGRVERSPEARHPGGSVLTASAAMRGVEPGAELVDMDDLAVGVAATLSGMDRQGPPRGNTVVASATWQLPEDRRLGGDAFLNGRVMDGVCSPMALAASGGICSPLGVDYAVPVWATADRPLRDGLPSFEAPRGGINYVTPPDIAALAGATAVWTEATDASPGATTKPVIQVTCGSTVQVFVDAVPTRLQFGNMQSRFAPEQVAANVELAMAAAARVAENNLLTRIQAAATLGVTAPASALLGATRDLLTALDQAVSAYRWLHRIDPGRMMTAIFPAWLKGMIRADLAREIGHEQSDQWNSLGVTDAQIDELLSRHGVNAIWHLDGLPARGSGTTYPLQGYTTQGGTAAVEPFPTKVTWYLFAEGQVQFLDGGRLDLGVIRDSTLDATNDFELLVEPFEGIAFRGFAGGVLEMVSMLCANGGSAGTISTTGSCA